MLFQGQQVQAGHDKISAQKSWVERVAAGERGYHGQVLGLNQRNVAVAALPAVMIADQARFGRCVNLVNDLNWAASFGPNTDPFNPAGAGKHLKEVLDVLQSCLNLGSYKIQRITVNSEQNLIN